MERRLGSRDGQKPITDWEQEAATANYTEIRHFGAAQTKTFAPAQIVQGSWTVCSPETVTNFTAVGYFFGRDLHQAQGEIHGKTIAVASDAVSRPVTVRYGWANVPEGNLFNRAGMAVSPFRTDVN